MDCVDVPGIHFAPYHICQEKNNGPHGELCLSQQTLISLLLQLGAVQANLGSLLTFVTEKIKTQTSVVDEGHYKKT